MSSFFKASAKLGFLGSYNKDKGITPFERYELGGDAFQQTSYLGITPLGLRGYDTFEGNDGLGNTITGFPIFNKYSMELRYPISLNPSATVYALGFIEGGNSYQSLKDYNPFDLKRSAGLGLRAQIPMIGIIGFDYGLGFDKTGPKTFQNFGKLSLIFGFEPE